MCSEAPSKETNVTTIPWDGPVIRFVTTNTAKRANGIRWLGNSSYALVQECRQAAAARTFTAVPGAYGRCETRTSRSIRKNLGASEGKQCRQQK